MPSFDYSYEIANASTVASPVAQDWFDALTASMQGQPVWASLVAACCICFGVACCFLVNRRLSARAVHPRSPTEAPASIREVRRNSKAGDIIDTSAEADAQLVRRRRPSAKYAADAARCRINDGASPTKHVPDGGAQPAIRRAALEDIDAYEHAPTRHAEIAAHGVGDELTDELVLLDELPDDDFGDDGLHADEPADVAPTVMELANVRLVDDNFGGVWACQRETPVSSPAQGARSARAGATPPQEGGSPVPIEDEVEVESIGDEPADTALLQEDTPFSLSFTSAIQEDTRDAIQEDTRDAIQGDTKDAYAYTHNEEPDELHDRIGTPPR